MSALDEEAASLAERVGDGTRNLLLLTPPMEACASTGCADLLSAPTPPEANVLYVTFTDTPDRRLEQWARHAGNERPARVGFVTVGESTRSATAATTIEGAGDGEITVRTVSSPGNLTSIGIKASQYLAEWEATGNRTVICFDSLTTLLQYADVQRVFRFLHVITGRVRSTGSSAHYHVDPTAHDERTLSTLKTLFDGMAEWDGEGWIVKNR